MYIELPNISNTSPEDQLAQIRSYIYKSNEQINAALSNFSVESIWKQSADIMSVSEDSLKDEKEEMLSQYKTIRDLIIKTADVAIKEDQSFSVLMNGNYVAQSVFGIFQKKTQSEIEANSENIRLNSEYTASLASDFADYKVDSQNYIKMGLLDDSEGMAVYGIDIGLLSEKFIVDGQEVINRANLKARITPDEFAFYQRDHKVAWIDENDIHFPKAHITGGSINIGDHFSVTEDGTITATAGTIGGLSISSLTESAKGVSLTPSTPSVKYNSKIGYSTLRVLFSANIRNINVKQRLYYGSTDGDNWTCISSGDTGDKLWITTSSMFNEKPVYYVKLVVYDNTDTEYEAITSVICVSDGNDGTSVRILGSAFIPEGTMITIGNNYDIFYDQACTRLINSTTTQLLQGDAYLIAGYLFVYMPDTDNFNCSGEIKGTDGTDGTNGQNAVEYTIESDVSSVNKSVLGTSCDPSVISFRIVKRDGGTSSYYSTSYRLFTYDGSKWTLESVGNSSSPTANLNYLKTTIANLQAVKCEATVDGITYTRTIPVLVSNDELMAWAKVENGQTVIDGAKIYTGSITANKLDVKELSALGATIAGFTIGDSELMTDRALYSRMTKDGKYYEYGINKGDVNNRLFYVATSNASYNPALAKYPFYVTCDGKLYCENAEISGKVTASSGTIAGFAIDSEQMRCTTSDDNWLAICKNGRLGNNIAIQIKNGTNNYPFTLRYDGSLRCTNATITGDSDIDAACIRNLTADYITSGVLDARKVSVTNLNASNIIGGTIDASKVRVTHLSADLITAGTISAKVILSNSGNLFTGSMTGSVTATSGSLGGGNDGAWLIDGYYGLISHYSNNTRTEFTPHRLNERSRKSDGSYEIFGTELHNIIGAGIAWRSGSSDRRLKKNIHRIDMRYDMLYDSLKPVKFKFKDNDSQTHIGFIAQDIVKSISDSRLESSNLNMVELVDDYYRVNKEQMIALNVWQIQKLKRRIQKLENKLEMLEDKYG